MIRRAYRPFLVFGVAGILFGALVGILAFAYAATRRPVEPAATRRPRQRRSAGRPLAAGATAAALLVAGLVGGAFAYDAARSDVIADGVRVGRVDVGGLTEGEARRKVAQAYAPLSHPLVLRSGARRFVLLPRRANLVVHVDEAISRALARSRGGWFLTRALRRLVGKNVDADVSPRVTFSGATVDRFAARVEDAADRPARPARVIPTAARLVVRPGQDGLEVASDTLRRAIERTLSRPAAARVLTVPARRTRPPVTLPDLERRYPAYITVDRPNFTLRLYRRLKLVRAYPIAVGQVGLETPAGLYHIQNKAVNPSWSVPNSAWAGSLAGAVIPPGPGNPLQARWMGIFDGAGIHGTADTASLGSAASHGCIRMSVPDVIDLYDRVDVGTPVFIG